MKTSIPRRRTSGVHDDDRPVRTRSLRALAVAARLERRRHATEAPPGRTSRRDELLDLPDTGGAGG